MTYISGEYYTVNVSFSLLGFVRLADLSLLRKPQAIRSPCETRFTSHYGVTDNVLLQVGCLWRKCSQDCAHR